MTVSLEGGDLAGPALVVRAGRLRAARGVTVARGMELAGIHNPAVAIIAIAAFAATLITRSIAKIAEPICKHHAAKIKAKGDAKIGQIKATSEATAAGEWVARAAATPNRKIGT